MPEPVHKAGDIARRSAAAAGKPCNTVIKTAATARELAGVRTRDPQRS